MPTTVTKIVDPDSGAGTDYTSLSAAEAAERAVQQDLVGNDRILVFECRSTSGTADTTFMEFTGWTTDSTHYIKIQSTGTNRHSGAWNASKYRIVGFKVSQDYTRIEGIQSVAPAGDAAVYVNASNVRVSSCIIDVGTAGTYSYGIFGGGTNGKIFNNLFLVNSGFRYGALPNNTGYVFENNTFICTSGTPYGIFSNSTDAVLTNNLSSGFANDHSFASGVSASSDYNAASGTDNPGSGAHNRTSQTFTFVNSGAGDYDLQTSDAGAYHQGSTLAAVTLGFTDDIKGRSRPGSGGVSIGAFDPSIASAAKRSVFVRQAVNRSYFY